MQTKECSRCHLVKPADQFSRNAKAADGLSSQCKECRAELKREYDAEKREENPHYKRDEKNAIQAKKLGITPDELAALRANPCDVCHGQGEPLSPYSGKGKAVLGWICKKCNRALGNLDHDRANVERALNLFK